MKLKMVAIYDSAAQAFARPFFVPAIGSALRSFRDEVNRPAEDNAVNSHPSDFELFELGEYDDGTGKFDCPDVPRSLARAIDLKESIS